MKHVGNTGRKINVRLIVRSLLYSIGIDIAVPQRNSSSWVLLELSELLVRDIRALLLTVLALDADLIAIPLRVGVKKWVISPVSVSVPRLRVVLVLEARPLCRVRSHEPSHRGRVETSIEVVQATLAVAFFAGEVDGALADAVAGVPLQSVAEGETGAGGPTAVVGIEARPLGAQVIGVVDVLVAVPGGFEMPRAGEDLRAPESPGAVASGFRDEPV